MLYVSSRDLVGAEKVKFWAIGGFLLLDIYWYGEHGMAFHVCSGYAAHAEASAANEQASIAGGKDIPYRNSARQHWEHIRADLHDNWDNFNLTQSSVVAYVRVCTVTLDMFNSPEYLQKWGLEEVSRKHLAKKLLTQWINEKSIRTLFDE